MDIGHRNSTLGFYFRFYSITHSQYSCRRVMSPTNKKKHGKTRAATSITAHTSNSPPNNSSSDPTASLVDTADTSSPVSATCVAFREFIQLADHQSIKLFFDIAATSPQGENLKPLWDRAFKEGLRVGHQLYVETVGKLNEAHKTGYEEGYLIGYDEGRRDNEIDWRSGGHSGLCSQLQVHQESSTQTDELAPPQHQKPPSLETGTQTTPLAPAFDATSYTEPPLSTFEATLSTTPQLFVAMSPGPPLIVCGKTATTSTITQTHTPFNSQTDPTLLPFDPTAPIFGTTSSTESQLVTTASPKPTIIDREKIAVPSPNTLPATVDTLSAATPTHSASKNSKFVGSPPKTTKYISPNPVLAPPAQQNLLNTSPPATSIPSLPFTAKTNHKIFDWSNEP